MEHVFWEMYPPRPYSLELTALSHGWVNLAPFSWTEGVLKRREAVAPTGSIAELAVRQVSDGKLEVRATSLDALTKHDQEVFTRRLARSLGFDLDLGPVMPLAMELDTSVAALLEAGGGRLLRGTTLFEDAAKTLFTTNTSWASTRRMVENLLELGRESTFPTAAELQIHDEEHFRTRLKIGYRARYLVEMVRLFLTADSDTEIIEGPILGLGDYGLSHVRFLSWDFGRIPVDSEVRKYMATRHGTRSDDEIHAAFADWGDYAFLGYKLQRQARDLNWIGD
jgi:hypothetical protein